MKNVLNNSHDSSDFFSETSPTSLNLKIQNLYFEIDNPQISLPDRTYQLRSKLMQMRGVFVSNRQHSFFIANKLRNFIKENSFF